jgi:predicted DNA-binding mobile mystery protein A
MKEKKLIIEQLDRKLLKYKGLERISYPPIGWIKSIRTALNMTLKQLGNRMSITSQSVKEIEDREINGSISLRVLNQVANALDMEFVYGFIPKNYTLKKMIEERALEMAKEIVNRTSDSMELENQKTSSERIKQAIEEKAEELKNKMPRYLWD